MYWINKCIYIFIYYFNIILVMKLSCSFCNFIEVSMKIIFVCSEMLGLKCVKKFYKEYRK